MKLLITVPLTAAAIAAGITAGCYVAFLCWLDD